MSDEPTRPLIMDPTQDILDDDIVNFCKFAPHSAFIDSFGRVIRLNSDIAVKFGVGVTEVEADNQRYAAKVLDPSIVRVPRVYRFFKSDDKGYLVMELVSGKVVKADSMTSTHFNALSRMLSHFQSLHRQNPGNLCAHGLSYSCPFSETGVALDGSVDEMEKWFRTRLPKVHGLIGFASSEFVFCHRDLAPRNILWQGDGSIYLLDWLTAGFYPVTFEICVLRNGLTEDLSFSHRAEEMVLSLSDADEKQVKHLDEAWRNSRKYAYQPLCESLLEIEDNASTIQPNMIYGSV